MKSSKWKSGTVTSKESNKKIIKSGKMKGLSWQVEIERILNEIFQNFLAAINDFCEEQVKQYSE